jgi:hypothetical protein
LAWLEKNHYGPCLIRASRSALLGAAIEKVNPEGRRTEDVFKRFAAHAFEDPFAETLYSR